MTLCVCVCHHTTATTTTTLVMVHSSVLTAAVHQLHHPQQVEFLPTKTVEFNAIIIIIIIITIRSFCQSIIYLLFALLPLLILSLSLHSFYSILSYQFFLLFFYSSHQFDRFLSWFLIKQFDGGGCGILLISLLLY